MTVCWTRSAQKTLRSIKRSISADSIYYAERTTQAIILRVEEAAKFPTAGHRVHEYPEAELREVHAFRYRIIYLVEGGNFIVVAIAHFKKGRSRVTSRLKPLLDLDEK